MQFSRIDELKKAVDDLTANVDKISKATSLDEINELEKASKMLLPTIQQVVVKCAWDLKQAVTQRRADIKVTQDNELNEELGI